MQYFLINYSIQFNNTSLKCSCWLANHEMEAGANEGSVCETQKEQNNIFDPMSVKTDPKSVIWKWVQSKYCMGLQRLPSVNLCTAVCYVNHRHKYQDMSFSNCQQKVLQTITLCFIQPSKKWMSNQFSFCWFHFTKWQDFSAQM